VEKLKSIRSTSHVAWWLSSTTSTM